MNRFGITGAHKSGKTTLAKAVAKRWNMKYVDAQLSSVLRAFGVSPNEQVPFAKRLEVQQNMVSHLINLLNDADENFITDRTFLDIAGYTLSYMPHTVSDIESETVKMIVDQCYRAQAAFYDRTIILGNSFEVGAMEVRDDKATFNWAWNFQLQAIMKGMVLNAANKCPVTFMPDTRSSLDSRIDKMEAIIGEAQRDSAGVFH